MMKMPKIYSIALVLTLAALFALCYLPTVHVSYRADRDPDGHGWFAFVGRFTQGLIVLAFLVWNLAGIERLGNLAFQRAKQSVVVETK